jgi:hypothetical protein
MRRSILVLALFLGVGVADAQTPCEAHCSERLDDCQATCRARDGAQREACFDACAVESRACSALCDVRGR